MSYAIWRVPFTPEMNSFNAKISGDQYLLACRHLQDCAIVANSANEFPSLRCSDQLPDALDKFSFRHQAV